MEVYMNYYTVNDIMTQDLGLKGNKLLVYAVIDTYSHNGGGHFTGSRGYLARITGCTLKSIDNALKELLEKDLIKKSYLNKKGTTETYISYQTTYRSQELAKDLINIKEYLTLPMLAEEKDIWFKYCHLIQRDMVIEIRVKYKIPEHLKTVLNRQIEFWNLQHKTNYSLEIVIEKDGE